MRNYLKKQMNGENYLLFNKHLELMWNYEGIEEWKRVETYNQKVSNRNKPMFKEVFDKLEDKFNYKEYVNRISNDKMFLSLDNTVKELWGIKCSDCLKLMLITKTYLGFLVEEIVVELIKECGGTTKQSMYLDTKKKTDILINNNIYLQLKNISFLDGSYGENRISEYLKHNEKLCFLFYQYSKENIFEIVSIGEEIFNPIVKLDGFSIHNSKGISVETFKQKVKQKVR